MKSKILFAITAMGFTLGVGATPAWAQATRTWVSGVGDDANPCSRTAPCKTFAGAISKTAVNGEIDCLDPGGFGTVTITKSITIDCDGTFGSILAAGTNGININDSATGTPNTIRVVIRALSINGAGTGLTGINFTSGASLVLEEVVVQNFNTGAAVGVNFRPAGAARLAMTHTISTGNGVGGTGGGLLVAPTGAGGSARASVSDSDFSNNAGFGIKADSTGNTGPSTALDISHSTISGGTTGVVVNAPAATTGITLSLIGSTVFNNGTALSTSGGTTAFVVGGSTITGNITEMSQSGGGAIQSFGDNYRANNNVPGVFGGPAIPKS
jgi:hypothetical protein